MTIQDRLIDIITTGWQVFCEITGFLVLLAVCLSSVALIAYAVGEGQRIFGG